MYLDFYGLNAEPFAVTPDPGFLFLTDSHKEALASLLYGTNQHKGFIVLVGEVGTGKTTILRSFLSQVEAENTKIYYIFNPDTSFEHLLLTLLEQETSYDGQHLVDHLIRQLQQKLIQAYEKGLTVILIIDEAQHIPLETLEKLRLLSNLETPKDKLLQIILAGQPELDQKLQKYELRQLQQRIAVRAVLQPLTYTESLDYIQHRLQTAANDSLPNQYSIFTHKALKLLARQGQGCPRQLNILCDNALIIGLGYYQRPIPEKIIKKAIQHYQQKPNTIGYAKNTVHKKFYWNIIFISICLGIVLLFYLPSLKFNSEAVSLSTIASIHQTKPLHSETAPDMLISKIPNLVKPNSPSVGLNTNIDFFNDIQIKTPVQAVDSSQLLTLKQQANTIKKTVKTGDTISALITQVYGVYSINLLNQLQQHNPHIQRIDAIRPGDQIIFPVLETGSSQYDQNL